MSERQTALVTGGGTGIGLATAKELAAAGFDLAIVGRRPEVLEEAAEQIRAAGPGGTVMTLPADLGDAGQAAAAVETVIGERGRLDGLVVNHGILDVTPFAEMRLDQWDEMLNITLRGAVACMLPAVRQMVAQGGGRIAIVTSVSGLVSDPGMAHYNASKAALNSLVKSVAVDHGRDGVTVNAIAPGWVRTPMISEFLDQQGEDFLAAINPLARSSRPEEVANFIRYLLTDAPTALTGEIVRLDQGQLAMAHRH